MAFIEMDFASGGVEKIDISNPSDEAYGFIENIPKSSSSTISLNKTPKYIFAVFVQQISGYRFFSQAYDVEKNKNANVSYGASGGAKDKDITGIDDYGASFEINGNQIRFINSSTNYAVRVVYYIYY